MAAPPCGHVATLLSIPCGDSQRMNSLRLIENSRLPDSPRAPASVPVRVVSQVAALRENLAYIQLNTPTPSCLRSAQAMRNASASSGECLPEPLQRPWRSPLSAVPVNHGKPCSTPWRVSGKNSVRDATRSMRCGARFGILPRVRKQDPKFFPNTLDLWQRCGRVSEFSIRGLT